MQNFLRVLRIVLPIAFGCVIAGIVPLPYGWEPWGPLVVIAAPVALIVFPKLWVLAPFLVIDMAFFGIGAGFRRDFTALLDHGAPPSAGITLIAIGVSSLVMRKPSPDPELKGKLAPNPEGIIALIAGPIAFRLLSTGQAALLSAIFVSVALVATAWFVRKGELLQSGRGWVAFLAGAAGAAAYYANFAAGDPDFLRHYVALAAVPVGVMTWAVQRAVFPYKPNAADAEPAPSTIGVATHAQAEA